MLSKPRIVDRPSQPYAAVKARVPMDKITSVADSMSGEFFAWMNQRSISLTSAPFFKYNSISDNGEIELEWGTPVATTVKSDDRILIGTLPAGRYASVVYTGPFTGLRDATGVLLKWIADNRLELDRRKTPHAETFGCRLELYHTDPRQEANSRKWQTEIAMRLKD